MCDIQMSGPPILAIHVNVLLYHTEWPRRGQKEEESRTAATLIIYVQLEQATQGTIKSSPSCHTTTVEDERVLGRIGLEHEHGLFKFRGESPRRTHQKESKAAKSTLFSSGSANASYTPFHSPGFSSIAKIKIKIKFKFKFGCDSGSNDEMRRERWGKALQG